MLINKYKPKKIKDLKGQDKQLEELKKSIINNKPVLIYGKVGIGKTASVYTIANELNYEILEVNASDLRNKEQIQSIVKNNLEQKSLFGKNKIILIDELDGINASDRGGLQELLKLFENVNFPIVLIANNPWNSKFSSLRRKCKLIEFNTLSNLIIYSILKDICKKEKINVNDNLLKDLALKSSGDARSAINDLALLMINDKNIDLRERNQTIFYALKNIFKTKDINLILNSVDSLNENFDEIFLWLEENLPKEYYGNDLARAYSSLSKADVYRKRILRQQYFRFLVYQKLFMSLGIALVKNQANNSFVNYKRNSRLLKMWIYNAKKKKKINMAEKLVSKLHMSKYKFLKELPYMKQFLKNKDVIKSLDLSKEEINYLVA